MMPTEFAEKDHADCAKAERLIDRAMGTSDDATRDELMDQAYRLLVPLVARQLPAGQYLYACYFLSRECGPAEDVGPRYIELIQAAAQAGHPRAQFRLAQMLDRGGELEHDAKRSARLFQHLAEQGDPYAQWVHGLNLLSGDGLPKDEALGLTFIERAGAGKFEGALDFLAKAYTDASDGYPRDEKQAQYYRKRLLDSDVVNY
jgi:TPR repeat protein